MNYVLIAKTSLIVVFTKRQKTSIILVKTVTKITAQEQKVLLIQLPR